MSTFKEWYKRLEQFPESNNAAQLDLVHYGVQETISVFGAVFAIAAASNYYFSRVGFDTPILPLINAASLCFYLLFLPQGFRIAARLFRWDYPKAWFTTDPVISLAGLIMMALFGFLTPLVNVSAILLFSVLGVLLFTYVFAHWVFTGNKILNILLLAGTVILANLKANQPLYYEGLIGGYAHIDWLIHSSITNMIRTYGIPSAGLDGVPYLHYHWGSHWLFAQTSNLLDIQPLSIYIFVVNIVFFPFLVKQFLSFVLTLCESVFALRLTQRARITVWFWLLFFIIANIGFASNWGADENLSYSESYMLAIALLLISAATLISAWGNLSNRQLGVTDLLLLLIMTPLMGLFISISKISVGFVFITMLSYLWWRLKLYKRPLFGLSMFLSGVFCLWAYTLVSGGGNAQGEGFNSLRLALRLIEVSLSLGVNLWSFLFLTIMLLMIHTPGKLDAEILILVVTLNVLVAGFVSTEGGSYLYFTDIQKWIALGFLLSRALTLTSDTLIPKLFRHIRFLSPVLCIWIVIGAYFLLPNFFNHLQIVLGSSAQEQASVRPLFFDGATNGKDLSEPDNAEQHISATILPNLLVVKALEKLATLPLSEKKQTLLWIPRSNSIYWSLDSYGCTADPLIAPAITGIALLDGLPAASCPNAKGYAGYDNMYQPRSRTRTKLLADPQERCNIVRKMGFSQVVTLEKAPDGTQVTQFQECP